MRCWLGDFEQAYTDSLHCVRHTVVEDHGGPPLILHHGCISFHLRSKGASVANISMNYVFMLIRSICSSLSIVVKVILEQVPHVWGPCGTTCTDIRNVGCGHVLCHFFCSTPPTSSGPRAEIGTLLAHFIDNHEAVSPRTTQGQKARRSQPVGTLR